MTGLPSAGKGVNSSIVIKDGALICTGVILLPGVLIGIKDIPKFSLEGENQ